MKRSTRSFVWLPIREEIYYYASRVNKQGKKTVTLCADKSVMINLKLSPDVIDYLSSRGVLFIFFAFLFLPTGETTLFSPSVSISRPEPSERSTFQTAPILSALTQRVLRLVHWSWPMHMPFCTNRHAFLKITQMNDAIKIFILFPRTDNILLQGTSFLFIQHFVGKNLYEFSALVSSVVSVWTHFSAFNLNCILLPESYTLILSTLSHVSIGPYGCI